MAFKSSTVNSALPSSVGRNWMQALTVCSARPRTADASPGDAVAPITTVQAPQSPSLQPSFVPVQRASSRSQSSTVRVGAASLTSTIEPRWKKRIGRVCMNARAVVADTPKLSRFWRRRYTVMAILPIRESIWRCALISTRSSSTSSGR